MKSQKYSLYPIAQDYFNSIFQEIYGMKCLILDSETLHIISLIFSHSQLLKFNVYLINKIMQMNQEQKKQSHLKAVYFVRPIEQNYELILKQIRNKSYSQFHLFFSNEIEDRFIEKLAQNDSFNIIKNIQQLYLDYYVVAKNCFSLNIAQSINLHQPFNKWTKDQQTKSQRIIQGLYSLLLSLRTIPTIRYLGHSQVCYHIATQLHKKMQQQRLHNLSQYDTSQNTLLIITQRRQDPICPLIIPWSYQCMLHQLLGIEFNKVSLKNNQLKNQSNFVISDQHDEFFRNNMYNNFADLYTQIKKGLQELNVRQNKSVKIETMDDMQNALQKIPQIKNFENNISKHVTITKQLTQILNQNKLMQISKIQQQLVSNQNRTQNNIKNLLKNQTIKKFQKLKLVIMFSIRYPRDKELPVMIETLKQIGVKQQLINLINIFQQSDKSRKADLFFNKNLKNRAKKIINSLFKEVPNVYTQHKSNLFQNVQYFLNRIPDILSGKTRENEFPIAGYGLGSNNNNKPFIIIFQIGGTTYYQLKQAVYFQEARILLGGTYVHNSRTYLAQMLCMKK